MKLTSLLGNSQRLDGGAMYGNAPRPMWEKWSPPDALHRIPLACRCLLIEDGDRKILAETGIGTYMAPALRERFGVVESEHRLLLALEQRGISPAEITHVVLSHLHFDHAGGALLPYEDGQPLRLAFPNAVWLVGAEAFARAEHPHARDRASFIPGFSQLLRETGRLHLIHGADDHPLGAAYSFSFSDGHTPGLTMLNVHGKRRILFASDMIPGVPWVHLPITMGYDRFPERLIEEKETYLSALEAEGGALFFTHDPHTALSGVKRDDKGRFSAVGLVATLDDLN